MPDESITGRVAGQQAESESEPECYSCGREAESDSLPAWESIAVDDHWRVVHAFGVSLPGWLVLLPRRHVTSIAELTDAEAELLGGWQVRLSRALAVVTGCAKTYVAQFAEREGFAHVHFHLVPRAADLPESVRGPRVFGLMGGTGLPAGELDRIALRIRSVLDGGEKKNV
ncbi:HIT family protein [Kitasatospora sp. NPDC048365]|uniref:HIT family protein n=1 Tax=Kitasatospora sp. NPDC048365 TaxID=3364050 RepID=UPI003711B139